MATPKYILIWSAVIFLAALAVMGYIDVAKWGTGFVSWLKEDPGAIWIGLGLVGLVVIITGEIN